MSEQLATYLVLSLPENVSINASSLNNWLVSSINGGKNVEVIPFKLPDFKIGTLDSLVQQSEDLSKLDGQLESSIGKILDIFNSIYDSKLVNNLKLVNDKPVTQFIENFKWNTSKFRLDKSLKDLIEAISTEALNLDNDVRSVYTNYNVAKSNLLAAERKKTGDLSVRSLHDIVKKSDFVLDSEHLTTLLIVVPKNLKSDFLHSYETLTQFVIPRSANIINEDSEFYLFNVTLFKKYVPEFLAAAREHKWIPREFNYSQELIDSLQREFSNASRAESILKNDLIRLTKTSYSDIISNWYHLKMLRIFIESVLRYGLPPNFYYFLVKLPAKFIPKAKKDLIDKYGYLGGNAFAVDKNGKISKDLDSNLHEYASLVDTDYQPFVLYELVIN
ncbi:hypothetical protein PACTADRAFT_48672 [Pachysolen tannophilus NRRL Y-2460]|uniref:V-type proton ATPase subunit C n=1 Tax=Pachysolen tannophilus NRRL Y-2460 TaxID=669874 RepID=A0A1E4TYR3_PACTA|nr:hypothetical protein PACTADRAFT_48672 [Pachysolen tannophilus NRRL Y-2460]